MAKNARLDNITRVMVAKLSPDILNGYGKSEQDIVTRLYEEGRYAKFDLPPAPKVNNYPKYPRQWLLALPGMRSRVGNLEYHDVSIASELYKIEVSHGSAKEKEGIDKIVVDGEYSPISGTIPADLKRGALFNRIGQSAILETSAVKEGRKAVGYPISAIEVRSVGDDLASRLFVVNSISRSFDKLPEFEAGLARGRGETGLLKILGLEALYRAQQSQSQ